MLVIFGVVDDVVGDVEVGFLGFDDVFVIISVPDGLDAFVLLKPFGHADLEATDNGAY